MAERTDEITTRIQDGGSTPLWQLARTAYQDKDTQGGKGAYPRCRGEIHNRPISVGGPLGRPVLIGIGWQGYWCCSKATALAVT